MPGALTIHALLLLALIPLAAAQLWPNCGRGQSNYSAGSTYETNLLNLLTTVRQNASSSPSLFASGALGAAPDTAWALVFCRGDVSASDCYDCVTRAGRDAATACNRSRNVALCYEQCYVRLANQDFRDPTGNSGEVRASSITNITSTDVVGYGRAVTGLLNATVQYAVDHSSRLFATGQWVGPDPGFSNIYSAVQCAPDLSPTQCRSCLQSQLGWWPTAWKDVHIAGPRCTLRFELYPFYKGRAMVLLPAKAAAPAPAPTAVPATTRGTTSKWRFFISEREWLELNRIG